MRSNQLLVSGAEVPLLNYKYWYYTQDQYKYGGGRLTHTLYLWNGSSWDLWDYSELSNATYPNTQSVRPCIGVPEGELVKSVYQRVGNLSSTVWGGLLNRRLSDLETNSGFAQYGVYGCYCNLTTSGQTAEATYYVTTPAGTQDVPPCPAL